MIFARLQMISQALWEPLGGIFAFAFGFLVLRFVFGKARKELWAWLLLSGAVYAFLLRSFGHIQGVRYHNIFIFSGLFAIIGLWQKFPLPRRCKQILFAIMLGVCLGRDMMFNPHDREIADLYRTIELDSCRFERKMGLAYDSNGTRHNYYTKLPMYMIERPIPFSDLLKNLRGNLSVYDGDWDAVYCFFIVQKSEFDLLPEISTLAASDRFTKLGECYLDSHRKKKIVVCRYLPSQERQITGGGEIIANGDFTRLATEKEKQGLINGLGKRMTRLQTEPFDLPAGWNFYQSLAGKSKAFMTRIERNDKYVLRLEADGYLAAIPQPIIVTGEKIFSFSVTAEKDSMLQFTRAGNNFGMLPMLLLPLKAGSERRFEIKLSPYANCEKNEIWFWLDHGTIELSDVRIK